MNSITFAQIGIYLLMFDFYLDDRAHNLVGLEYVKFILWLKWLGGLDQDPHEFVYWNKRSQECRFSH